MKSWQTGAGSSAGVEAILGSLGAALFEADPTTLEIAFAARGGAEILRAADDAAAAREFWQRIHIDDCDRVRALFGAVAIDGAPRSFSFRMTFEDAPVMRLRAELRTGIASWAAAASLEGLGVPRLHGLLMRALEPSGDVAGQAHDEEHADLFSRLFAVSPYGVTLITVADERYVAVNDAYLGQVGYRRDEIIGRTVPEVGILVNADDRARLAQAFAAQGRVRDEQIRYRVRTGEVHVALLSVELVRFGGVECALGVSRDLSEYLGMQAALRESEEHLHFLFDNVHNVALLTLDVRGSLSSWNTSARHLFGYRPEEMMGADVESLCEAVESKQLNEALVSASIEGRAELECPLLRRDGRTFPSRVVILAVQGLDHNPGGHVLVVSDRSERHESREALQAALDEALNTEREARTMRAENASHRAVFGELGRALTSPASDAGKLAHIALVLGELGKAGATSARAEPVSESTPAEVRQRELVTR